MVDTAAHGGAWTSWLVVRSAWRVQWSVVTPVHRTTLTCDWWW